MIIDSVNSHFPELVSKVLLPAQFVKSETSEHQYLGGNNGKLNNLV